MAYLRASEESPVYFYERVGGGWECCGCAFATSTKDPDFIQYFTDPMAALAHLYKHVSVAHLNLAQVDKVARQMTGLDERTPDATIASMLDAIAEHGNDPKSRIVSDDADVPERLRMTTRELCNKLIEEGAKDGNDEVVEACQEMLRVLDKRGVSA